MPFTTNPNNKYTVSIITDPTGGDGMSTPSGYESVYVMEIIPNPGEVIIAGDLTVDSNSFQPGTPPQPSLHSITPVNGLFQLQEYFMQSPAGHPEIDVIGLYEVYVDDVGNEWDYTQGPQPSITTNTNPIKLRLYISLATSFTTTIPIADTNIFLDIDLASLTPIYGCTDPTAFNYNALANTDDGSCTPIVVGCMDALSDTYDATANTPDATLCEYWGCIDSGATNYGVNYTHDCGGNLTSIDTTCCQYAGACNTPINLTSGAISLNYDSPNNVDCSGMPGSADDSCCHYAVPDCLDVTASNYHYNVASNTVNGTAFDIDCNGDLNGTDYNCCNYITNSCVDGGQWALSPYPGVQADNYDPNGTHDCQGNDISTSYYTSLIQSQGLWNNCCTYTIDGCMDDSNSGQDTYSFSNFAGFGGFAVNSPWINTNTYNFCVGFTSPGTSPQQLYYSGITGCFYSNGYEYENYNPDATVTNLNTCIKGGCMDDGTLDVNAGDPYTSPYPGIAPENYDSRATYDNGTCVYMGCMDPNSSNYDSFANVDSVLTTPVELRQFLRGNHVVPPVPAYDPANGIVGDCAGGYNLGCTDPTSSNYDATATVDDGSCCVDGCMDDGSLLIANGDPYDSPYPGQSADVVNPLATCDDGTYCTYTNITSGCTDPTAFNYDPLAITDDGSCYWEGCAEAAVDFAGNIAATNYLHDCQGVDRSSAFYSNPLSNFHPSAECNVQTNYPGTRNNACEYQCPTYTATVDSSTGGIVIDIDATNMPNTGLPTIEVRFRYGEVGTQVNTWQGYGVRARINAATAQLTYDRASGWTAGNGASNITSFYPSSNFTIWKSYNTAMQPITFANTPNEVAYTINASAFVAKPGQNTAPLPNFGWYWGSNGGMSTCRQTLFSAGFAYRLGCTDPLAGNYDSLATVDDGSCTYPCDCGSNFTISQSLVIDSCGARILATIDNTTTDPACIPCEFPSLISLIVDENVTPPLWTNDQLYVEAFNFYNNFGNLSFQSGQPLTTPLRIWDANASYLGGSGSNFANITDYPIVLEWFITTNPSGPEINTDSTSPEYDYDIDGRVYYTKLEFASGMGAVTSAPLNVSYTPSIGCGDSNAINFVQGTTCPSSSSCYFCPDSTSSNAIAGVNMVNDFTVDIQAVSNLVSGPTYTATHNPLSPTGGSPVPPDNFTWSFTNVNHGPQGDITGTFSGSTITASPTYPASLADFDDPLASAYPPGYTIVENGTTYNCSGIPSTSHLVTLTLEWLDPNTGNSACTVSSPYGNLTPEPFYFAYGCTDPLAFNYGGPCVTIDDGSCTPAVYGCLCSSAINYFPGANIDDGSCIYAGCTSTDPGPNPDINGFCSNAVFDSSIYTCGNSLSAYTSYGTYYEYNSMGIYVGVANTPATGIPTTSLNTGHACGNVTAGLANIGYSSSNYDPLATINNGTC